MNNPLEDDINTRPQNEVRNPKPWELLGAKFQDYFKTK